MKETFDTENVFQVYSRLSFQKLEVLKLPSFIHGFSSNLLTPLKNLRELDISSCFFNDPPYSSTFGDNMSILSHFPKLELVVAPFDFFLNSHVIQEKYLHVRFLWKNESDFFSEYNKEIFNGEYEGTFYDSEEEILMKKGIYRFFEITDMMIYEGEFKDNLFEGNGVMMYANGDRYEGEWKSNKKEGKGAMMYANGDRYEGQWKSNKKEGNGVMMYANGDRYEANGKMIGK